MPIQYHQNCAIARGLELVGERWALIIVKELMSGPRKFQELRDELAGLSSNVLSSRLKSLEEAGIIERRIYSQHPLRAEYLLTPSGRALERVLIAMGLWAIEHLSIPIERVHKVCGHQVEVHVCCPSCEQDVGISETKVRLLSSAKGSGEGS